MDYNLFIRHLREETKGIISKYFINSVQ